MSQTHRFDILCASGHQRKRLEHLFVFHHVTIKVLLLKRKRRLLLRLQPVVPFATVLCGFYHFNAFLRHWVLLGPWLHLFVKFCDYLEKLVRRATRDLLPVNLGGVTKHSGCEAWKQNTNNKAHRVFSNIIQLGVEAVMQRQRHSHKHRWSCEHKVHYN